MYASSPIVQYLSSTVPDLSQHLVRLLTHDPMLLLLEALPNDVGLRNRQPDVAALINRRLEPTTVLAVPSLRRSEGTSQAVPVSAMPRQT